jgi:hypothetical protein
LSRKQNPKPRLMVLLQGNRWKQQLQHTPSGAHSRTAHAVVCGVRMATTCALAS